MHTVIKKVAPLVFIFAALLPLPLFAAFEAITAMMRDLLRVINMVIPLTIAVAVVVFFYGLVKFLARVGGSTQAVEQGRRIMIWGIVVIFVMVTLWGIIFLLQNIFGVGGVGLFGGGGTTIVIPIPFPF